MYTAVYSGSFGDASAGSNGISTKATGQAIPSTATIKSIRFALDISADAYSSSASWVLYWFAVGGTSGSPSAYSQSDTMYDDEYTFSGNMSFSASDVSKFTSGECEVYAKANTTHSATSYLGGFTITVEYENTTACTKPTGLKLSASASYGEIVTLSWTAGKAGQDNAVTGYEIQRGESSDGKTWGDWSTFMVTDATNVAVKPPVTYGNYYRYRVRTRGEAGEAYYSPYAYCSGYLKKSPPDKCTEPSGVKLSSLTSSGSNVTLSWSAGGGGTGNTFDRYQIARKLSTDGKTWGSLEIVSSTTGLTKSVAPPTAFGSYYLYYVRTVGSAGTSFASPWAACSEMLQKVRPALTVYTDATITAGETYVKAVHMAELQSNINALRVGLGLSAYSFTAIQAGYTSLGDWNTHVREMRTAIDGITSSHEAWITLGSNRPRADVLMQLRRVVAAI